MNKIAVDIVLLPPDKVMKDVISLINYTADSVIKLNTINCLPHISLAMAAIDRSDLADITKAVDALATNYSSVLIEMEETKSNIIDNGRSICDISVKISNELKKLHIDSMELLRPFLINTKVRTAMFFSPPEVAAISANWVQHYFDNPNNFNPHITLGEGVVSQIKAPIKFMAERFALCHLGSYCTCCKVLSEAKLASK
jgi:hypothetical protein